MKRTVCTRNFKSRLLDQWSRGDQIFASPAALFLPTGIMAVGLFCLPQFTCSSGINVKLGHNCIYVCNTIRLLDCFILFCFYAVFVSITVLITVLKLSAKNKPFSADKLILEKCIFSANFSCFLF